MSLATQLEIASDGRLLKVTTRYYVRQEGLVGTKAVGQ